MARSRRHTPISAMTTSVSESLRSAVRVALAQEREVLPALREVSDPWSFAKDGKSWDSGADMRK